MLQLGVRQPERGIERFEFCIRAPPPSPSPPTSQFTFSLRVASAAARNKEKVVFRKCFAAKFNGNSNKISLARLPPLFQFPVAVFVAVAKEQKTFTIFSLWFSAKKAAWCVSVSAVAAQVK